MKNSVAYKYAKTCVRKNYNKAPKYVKKQCKEWIKIADGKSKEAFVDLAAYEKLCRILKLIMHPDTGKSMYESLENYAWLLITAVFCTKSKKDGTMYYRTAILEIARKNYKTFVSAVIFIIGMLTLPRFSRLFSVAPDYKLSSELRLACRKIIKVSPALDKHFKVMRDMISCKATDSEYTPLAYSTDRMDGKLANIFLADESGAMDSYPIEAMRSSQINLGNKLGIIISTQYPVDNSGFIDEVDLAKKILDGLFDDKRTFALLYEPDDEIVKQWETNDLAIYQANPVAVDSREMFENLKKSCALAVLYENKRENFLCKHLNIKYKGLGTEGYVDVIKVRECKRKRDLEFWRGKRVYVGVDLSLTEDNTAVAIVCYHEGKIYAHVMGFLPKDRVEIKMNKENVNYPLLMKENCCIACGEEVIDYLTVEEYVLGLEKELGCEIVQLGYDRYNAVSSVRKFETAENPIECVEIKQHSSVLHPATKLLKERILQKQFVYDENLLLEINFSNARCTEDTNLNKYVNKKRSAGKVDMVVALINAVYLLNENELLTSEMDWAVQM